MNLLAMFRDLRQGHSTLQIDSFITAKSGHGHPYGMYQQALREMHARATQLFEAYIKQNELVLDLMAASRAQKAWAFTAKQRDRRARAGLTIERLLHQRDMLDLSIREMEREFTRFYRQAAALREQIGELTEARHEELDREYWGVRLKQRIALECVAQGAVSQATLDLLLWLPPAERAPLLEFASNPLGASAWLRDCVIADPPISPAGARIEVRNQVQEVMRHLTSAHAEHPRNLPTSR